MTTDFRIVLISDAPYSLGLLKGYCHVRNYEISQIAANTESIIKITEMQPDMIILALPSAQTQLKMSDLALIRGIRIKHVIPVCCLGKMNNASGLDRKIESWVDVFLDDPLDIRQLDNFLRSNFSHHDVSLIGWKWSLKPFMYTVLIPNAHDRLALAQVLIKLSMQPDRTLVILNLPVAISLTMDLTAGRSLSVI